MYVREKRGSNPVVYSDSDYPNKDITADQTTEETYSWRTGRRSRNGTDNTYIIPAPPTFNQGITENINSRLRYINEISANLGRPNGDKPSQTGRRLTHDTGHDFINVKYHNTGRFSATGTDQKTGALLHRQGSVSGPRVVPNGYATLMKTTEIWNGPFGQPCPPTNSQRNADMASLFSSARPDASIAGWGETIFELLSGNIPKMVTRLGRNIASGKFFDMSLKEISKEVGSDYLNGQFGWVPFMMDFQATLERLLQVHDFLFDSTYRRKRATRTREFSAATRYDPGTGSNSSWIGDPDIITSGNFRPPNSQGLGKHEYRYDTRLSARFTRARATTEANKFADTALDIIQHFGVYYPSVAWDIVPFSFLVDWCFYLGKGIDNYSTYSKNSGSFLTDYAYATTRSVATFRFPGQYHSMWNGTRFWHFSFTDTVSTTIATRRTQGTPFGFGVDLSGLSTQQYAILVALGLALKR